MKRNMKRFLLAIGVVTLGLGFTACEDEPDKFELTDGNPTISYIRPQDVAAKDSLLTSAYTGSGICIVGNNLTSIKEILGHSSLAATQVYTHNSVERLKNVYKNAHPRAKNGGTHD